MHKIEEFVPCLLQTLAVDDHFDRGWSFATGHFIYCWQCFLLQERYTCGVPAWVFLGKHRTSTCFFESFDWWLEVIHRFRILTVLVTQLHVRFLT